MEAGGTPPQLKLDVAEARKKLIPKRAESKYCYTLAYEKYSAWKAEKMIEVTTQGVLLVYFDHLSQKFAPSTLWSTYSMLKKFIHLNEGIDISKYQEVTMFLTNNGKGYLPKKSKTLEGNQQICKFLIEAPEAEYLEVKVAAVFGIFGACRKCELVKLLQKDVIQHGNLFKVYIRVTKNGKPRWFVIPEEYSSLVLRYIKLRPNPCSTDRFFLNYQNGKCTNQPIGENKFGSFPKLIGTFLGLPNADAITGHSFRRSAASIVANEGGSIEDVQNVGGWDSPTVAKGYVDTSLHRKKAIGNLIAQGIACDDYKQPATKMRKFDSNCSRSNTFSVFGEQNPTSSDTIMRGSGERKEETTFSNMVFSQRTVLSRQERTVNDGGPSVDLAKNFDLNNTESGDLLNNFDSNKVLTQPVEGNNHSNTILSQWEKNDANISSNHSNTILSQREKNDSNNASLISRLQEKFVFNNCNVHFHLK